MSDHNERACTAWGSLLHYEECCPTACTNMLTTMDRADEARAVAEQDALRHVQHIDDKHRRILREYKAEVATLRIALMMSGDSAEVVNRRMKLVAEVERLKVAEGSLLERVVEVCDERDAARREVERLTSELKTALASEELYRTEKEALRKERDAFKVDVDEKMPYLYGRVAALLAAQRAAEAEMLRLRTAIRAAAKLADGHGCEPAYAGPMRLRNVYRALCNALSPPSPAPVEETHCPVCGVSYRRIGGRCSRCFPTPALAPPPTADKYDMCPHCLGSFSYQHPGEDGTCPWCKKFVANTPAPAPVLVDEAVTAPQDLEPLARAVLRMPKAESLDHLLPDAPAPVAAPPVGGVVCVCGHREDDHDDKGARCIARGCQCDGFTPALPAPVASETGEVNVERVRLEREVIEAARRVRESHSGSTGDDGKWACDATCSGCALRDALSALDARTEGESK